MTRKDYEVVAGVLAEAGLEYMLTADEVRAMIGKRLADEFQRDNPHFDRAKFFLASGLTLEWK